MLGFSLAHGHFAWLLLAPFLAGIWLVAALISIVVSFVRRTFASRLLWTSFGMNLGLFGVLSLPPNFYQFVFAGTFARSPAAADLATYAAGQGQTATTEALIRNGVPPNARDREGRTIAHGAAVSGDVDLLRFLHDRHADFNALTEEGDSALQLALDRGQNSAADYLRVVGAKPVKGTPEQRRLAIDRKVQRDIERLNRSEGIQP